jgi:hypothetical protein
MAWCCGPVSESEPGGDWLGESSGGGFDDGNSWLNRKGVGREIESEGIRRKRKANARPEEYESHTSRRLVGREGLACSPELDPFAMSVSIARFAGGLHPDT